MGIRRLFSCTVRVADACGQAPFSHFFMKLVFAAPESGLPSWLTALVAQVSAMHFFMNEVLAAPASGLPYLPTALLSQVLLREGWATGTAAVKASAVRWPTPGIVRGSAPACASGWQSAVAEALMSSTVGSARKPWQ